MILDVKTINSLEKVFPYIEPKGEQKSASIFRNERFNFQVAILSEFRSFETKVKVTGPLAKYCTVRMVDYVPARQAHWFGVDDYYLKDMESSATLYPDVLRPIPKPGFIIPIKQWASVWVTVHAKEGLPAGKHNIGLIVTNADGEKKKVKFELTVLDAMLGESDIIYTNWMHYDAIANYYNVKPWSEKFYKYLGTFIDSAVTHGMNMLYVPLYTPPLDTRVGGERLDVQLLEVYEEDGEYRIDYSRLDEFIDFALAHGIKYFEMCHLTTQWGAKAVPKIMAHTKNGYKRIFGWDTSSLSDEYKKFVTLMLTGLDEYLKNKGVDKQTYFHISDEPSPEHYDHFKQVFDFIRPLIKDYKVMDATSATGRDILDIPIMAISHLDGPVDPEKDWVYYCCSNDAGYVTNRFIGMPSQRNRILGFQLYDSGVKGFLHWGFNFYNSCLSYYPINPFVTTDADGGFPAGDSFVVYPGEKGAWDSLRLEVFFDAFQDRMALKLLESLTSRDYVISLLRAEGVEGWRTYPRNAEWHLAFREKINKEIAERL